MAFEILMPAGGICGFTTHLVYLKVYSHTHKRNVVVIIFTHTCTTTFFVHFLNNAVRIISPSPTNPTPIPVVAIRIIGFFQAVNTFEFLYQFKS